MIDLTPINGDLQARKDLASRVRMAAENTGFFYIKNHGIQQQLIEDALEQAKRFFAQPESEKQKVASRRSDTSVGYIGVSQAQTNRTETKDRKETFSIQYDSRLDPENNAAGEQLDERSREHDYFWEGVKHLDGFQAVITTFWQRRLELARKLCRIFALALDLPENYFDEMITHPGADTVFLHYPGTEDAPNSKKVDIDVGIGSHTDIQLFTLLWQDGSGGLQILSKSGQWLEAPPRDGTIVVNIADFLQRLSNNQFNSTVHRVYNRQSTSRYSQPFFFGLNPEAICSVVPTCVDEEHPPLYEPISCGKVSNPAYV